MLFLTLSNAFCRAQEIQAQKPQVSKVANVRRESTAAAAAAAAALLPASSSLGFYHFVRK